MRISRRKRPQKPLIPHYKKNNEIQAEELLVLDGEGRSLGEMSKRDALDAALEQELDLVEINPKANPPVAKLINFTEFKYQKEKEAHKQKAHSRTSETKGVRLSVRIGKGDLEMKLKQAEKFLNRGDKVKIELQMKGRENARPDLAKEVVKDFAADIAKDIDIKFEQEVEKQGRKVTAVIVKK
ncbi:translation initiation factor IF-3 [Candidatus Parcubacteria bacterium]|nr:MAG: translation initiation factor IF-3 [Candidatus Parcubacteria bacterium]